MKKKIIKYLKKMKNGDTLNNISKNIKEYKPSVKAYLTVLICENIIIKERNGDNFYYKLNKNYKLF